MGPCAHSIDQPMGTKKRRRAQAASIRDEQPPTSVELQHKEKHKEKKTTTKPKFSKPPSPEPVPANDAHFEPKNVQLTGSGASIRVAAASSVKKSGNKENNKSVESTAAAQATTATKKKARGQAKGSEIDALFTQLKTEKKKKNAEDEQHKLAEVEAERREMKEKQRLQQQIKKLEAQNTNSTAVGLNPDPRPVRYDENGLPIYTESSLQIGKGGGSKDCPFDCWCCF
uniref:DUF1764-domain-containing protein n=1 Tax=Peronospora matthiolae TaxID=2874970 RepID=A0AAV1UQC7_9STRA